MSWTENSESDSERRGIQPGGIKIESPEVISQWRRRALHGTPGGGNIDAEPYTGRRSDGLQYSGLCFDKFEAWIVDERLAWARRMLIELPSRKDFVGWGGISYRERFTGWYDRDPIMWHPRVPFVDEDGSPKEPDTVPNGEPLPLPELARAMGVPLKTLHTLKERGKLVTWRWNGIIYSNRAHYDASKKCRRIPGRNRVT